MTTQHAGETARQARPHLPARSGLDTVEAAVSAKLNTGASYSTSDLCRAARLTRSLVQPETVQVIVDRLADEQLVERIPVGEILRYQLRAKPARRT